MKELDPLISSGSAASARSPLAKARAARQRERILDAAELCFIKSGFHAASMAHIAQTAGMSQGLIYRYFDSKSAIVKAIIARHLESDQYKMIGRLNSVEDVSRAILETFECWRRRDDPKMNAVLMLELTAESTRDPEIARAVRSKDRMIGAQISQAVRRSARSRGVRLSAAAMRSRAVLLQSLVEGLALRVVRDPKLQRATLKPALDAIITVLMS
ncbi:MAG TPA: TetR/AcrR family transcriptional regulator [Steroidobacteraceae bacterium]|nr:TetR/AcrR family transcriptional regulator [Steroidobacteraceae bacterium]